MAKTLFSHMGNMVNMKLSKSLSLSSGRLFCFSIRIFNGQYVHSLDNGGLGQLLVNLWQNKSLLYT